MVKPLSFKGDKKPKKRKRTDPENDSLEKKPRDANEDDDQVNDDTWVSAEVVTDVSGPVMIVLPTEKPSALACDAGGKVFTIPVENIVDGNPSSAEPHDVRQVWVANKVAGSEQYRFRGHHGRYLSCDRVGKLSAMTEAVSQLESFNIISTADTPGTFQIQTSDKETFLSPTETARGIDVKCDADTISFSTTLRIRMQARFKPRLKAVKEEKALAKISRKELEDAVGRRLDEGEVKILKRARRDGDYHERLLELKVKGKHDKYG